MERRSRNRKSVKVKVYLSDGNINGVSRCIATNISANGIFLKADPLDVPRNKCVKLLFALSTNASNVVRLRRVTAIVTHTKMDGVGMRFCNRRRYSKERTSGQLRSRS